MISKLIEYGHADVAGEMLDPWNVIADSISPEGDRLTSMQVQGHRFILSEFNTHRRFSRNSASSRAIPVSKQIGRILEHPAVPLVFPAEQRGMQGGEALTGSQLDEAKGVWLDAMHNAVQTARALVEMGVHKSVVNRVLEPFMWHTIVISSTEFSNFFNQRVSKLAQPEIRAVALCMEEALHNSVPDKLEAGQWHRPYIRADDKLQVGDGLPGAQENADLVLNAVSAARCARVSYLTQEGVRDMEQDMDLYNRLVDAEPPHWSPLEHVAKPAPWMPHPAEGNFSGWVQLRGLIEMDRAA